MEDRGLRFTQIFAEGCVNVGAEEGSETEWLEEHAGAQDLFQPGGYTSILCIGGLGVCFATSESRPLFVSW